MIRNTYKGGGHQSCLIQLFRRHLNGCNTRNLGGITVASNPLSDDDGRVLRGGMRNRFSTCSSPYTSWTVKSPTLLPDGIISPSHSSVRFKHKNAKMGQHLQNLNEMAHEQERQQAEERRQKKKDKKSIRKGKSDDVKHTDSAPTPTLMDGSKNDDDDIHDDESFDDEEDDAQLDENVLPDPSRLKERMMKHVIRFEEYLKTVRGAEPTPELFDNILVDAYGDPNTPLQAVAQVVLNSHTLATATCFDAALAKSVSNAIRDKLSLNPSVEEGGIVQIPIPRVSLETRVETANTVKKRSETFRQRIRGVRRKALDIVKQGVAGKLEHISKDDAFRVQKEIENLTNDMIQNINTAMDKKLERVMSV